MGDDDWPLILKNQSQYLHHMYNVLPTPYASQDSNRLTLLYFVVAGLDILGELDRVNKEQLVSYIYAQQVLPDKDDPDRLVGNCGFRGGSFYGRPYNPNNEPTSAEQYDKSHIAMIYTALSMLRMCGDDFSQVQKQSILKAIKSLQLPDGSFECVHGAGENDMRFVFCAAASCKMLNDFSGMDVDLAIQYIISSQSFDGGIGQGPGQESHGGSTYCAVAALFLMGRLDDLPRKDDLVKWCLDRQVSGFQGRSGKPPDSCYAFWIGCTLAMLNAYKFVEFPLVKSFQCSCVFKAGGFSKVPNAYPDVMHTYLSLGGLSLGGAQGLKSIDPALGYPISL
eukprot:TRINITY_DN625_c0_g1_i1.p1 TRINITY_DN625_c0_g1~~TRINITY_DN625_c0_g1_i1.p1  ORF type:complete len:337 (+),score=22.79 TRINITY_DN625_c0_g1_i1:3-1013(+)